MLAIASPSALDGLFHLLSSKLKAVSGCLWYYANIRTSRQTDSLLYECSRPCSLCWQNQTPVPGSLALAHP